MIKSEDLKKMKEIEIIRLINNPDTSDIDYNLASSYLITKYENLIHKHWHLLQKQMNYSGYTEEIEDDYYDEAYEALLKAITRVKDDRIYDDKFKLVQLASWYVGNVRRKYIKQILKKNTKKRGLVTVALKENEEENTIDSFVEKAYFEQVGYKQDPLHICEIIDGQENCKKGIEKCKKMWTKDENKVYELLEKGKTRGEISKELKIKPDILNPMYKKMYKDLKRALDYDNLNYSYI